MPFKRLKSENEKYIRYFAIILILVIFAVGTSLPLDPRALAIFYMIGLTVTIAFVVAVYAFAYEDGSTRKAFIAGGLVVAMAVNGLELMFLIYGIWAFAWIGLFLWSCYFLAASIKS